MNIKAKEIAITKEDGILIIGFLEELEQKYFMIQDALGEYGEQDIELDMDTYYIEINDQLFSTYGGINKIKMSAQRLVFTLNNRGLESLKEDEITIDFTLSREKYLELKKELNQLSNRHSLTRVFL